MKYLFLLLCLVLLSCSSTEYGGCAGGSGKAGILAKTGQLTDTDYNSCDPPPPEDDIILSSEELLFNVNGDIDSISTEGEKWYMTTLEIGDTVIFLQSNEYYVRGGHENLHLYESGVITIDERNGYDVISIETPWFKIIKPENKKIIFSIDNNETGRERKLLIHLSSYNSYHTSIKITQSGE